MLVGWYLRRAIPWMALLGCCAAAVLLVVALDRWPTTAMVLLPALVAACAAAAAFCFDEVSLPVVEVTPRGAVWRRAARLVAAGIPLVLWTSAVLVRPGDLPLSRGSWWLVGFAAIDLTVGVAALASRRAITSPGGSLASAVVMVVISPVVVAAFLGWDSLYPIDDFASGVLTFWLAVAGAGALACVAALRPGVDV
ncbi:MAG: hypothetical protein JWR85_2793 [Marmoricola sp.]|nr:hypothetical protein [Marmoricola sp.]